MMGLIPAPYFTTKDILVVDKMMRRDINCRESIFRWMKVVLNLHRNSLYDPTRPWVYTMRTDRIIVVDFFTYIDDGRPTALTE